MLYESLVGEWNRYEFLILYNKEDKPKRSSRKGLLCTNYFSVIPLHVKIKYIKMQVKKIVVDYIARSQGFCGIFNTDFDTQEIRYKKNMILDFYNAKPESKNIFEKFTFEVFKELIQNASKERYDWSYI